MLERLKKTKILAVADTNVAADNLYEGLRKLGVTSVARIGVNANEDLVEEQLKGHTLYARLLEQNTTIQRKIELRERITLDICLHFCGLL